MIDFSIGFAARSSARLRSEHVVWLTTVDKVGSPQPRPVWFQWNGETFLVFSQEAAAKIRHIRRNDRVSINLNSDPKGNEVTVFLGKARLLASWPDSPRVEEYLEKYRAGMQNLDLTIDTFKAEYNVPIEIEPTSVRGF